MDAGGQGKIVLSKSFLESSNDFFLDISQYNQRNIYKETNPTILEALIACQFIPLHKNSSLTPNGVAETLKRIIGKVVVSGLKERVKREERRNYT